MARNIEIKIRVESEPLSAVGETDDVCEAEVQDLTQRLGVGHQQPVDGRSSRTVRERTRMGGLSTNRVFAVWVAIYALALLPALFVENYLQSPIGILVYVPYLSVYLFDWLGVPWLLLDGGTCGWGWCAPSWFGWMFAGAVWAGLAWAAAWTLTWTTTRLVNLRSARRIAENGPER